MSFLKTKIKKSKLDLMIDAEVVARLKNTVKRIKELGNQELNIHEEVQRFLIKLLDAVDKELDAIAPNKTP